MAIYRSIDLSEFADKFSSELIPNNIFVVKDSREYAHIMRELFNSSGLIIASGEDEKKIIIHSDTEYQGFNFFVFYQYDMKESLKAS